MANQSKLEKNRKLKAVERMASSGMDIDQLPPEPMEADGENYQPGLEARDSDGRYIHKDSLTVRSGYTAAREAIIEFHDMYAAGIASLKPNDDESHALSIATGRIGMTERLLLSNRKIRWEAAKTLIKLVERYWRKTQATKGRRWWFVTFVSDAGNTLEREPKFYLSAFQKNVYRLLHDAKLNAVYALEIQALTNFPDNGDGRSFMLHAHALVWSDDPGFDPQAVEEKLCASKRLRSKSVNTVRFEPIDDVSYHMKWRAYYLLKAPFMGKNHRPSNLTKSGFELAPVRLRKDLATRLMECLTQIEFTQIVWGVGQGKTITREWKSQLKAWHAHQYRKAKIKLDKDFDVGALWQQLRGRRPNNRQKPVEFPEGPLPASSPWDLAAERRLALEQENKEAREQGLAKPSKRKKANAKAVTPLSFRRLLGLSSKKLKDL